MRSLSLHSYGRLACTSLKQVGHLIAVGSHTKVLIVEPPTPSTIHGCLLARLGIWLGKVYTGIWYNEIKVGSNHGLVTCVEWQAIPLAPMTVSDMCNANPRSCKQS